MNGPELAQFVLTWIANIFVYGLPLEIPFAVLFLLEQNLEPRRYRIYKYTKVDGSVYWYMKRSRLGWIWFDVKEYWSAYGGCGWSRIQFASVNACCEHVTNTIQASAMLRAQPKPVQVGEINFKLGHGTATEPKLVVDGVEVPLPDKEDI